MFGNVNYMMLLNDCRQQLHRMHFQLSVKRYDIGWRHNISRPTYLL